MVVCLKRFKSADKCQGICPSKPMARLLAMATISEIFMLCVLICAANETGSAILLCMKILLVFTGGTIGSQRHNGSIDTDPAAGFRLIQLFQQHDAKAGEVEFKTLQPLQILSENLHPQAWQTLIAAIEAEKLSDFDGIIVTHGTDTLAFSAAALGIYFNGLNIPLLMVSSDLPLDNPNANGLPNFLCAVEYIRQGRRPGVFVPYRNPRGKMQLHIATRLSSCLPLSSDFISVQNKPYLDFEQGHFLEHHPLPPAPSLPLRLENRFAGILLIRPYPGLDYSVFDLAKADAVLHDLYHSGTACASRQWGGNHSLIEFSHRCQQRETPLYLAPSIRGEAAYSSTRELLSHGATMIWNCSMEAAFTKLSLACANWQDRQTINDFLEQDIAWELV